MTDEEKELARQKNKERMAEKRANMDNDEKEEAREKDRLRKKKESNKVKEQICLENERELRKEYKMRMRKSRSEEQVEFDKLEFVIRKREFRKRLEDSELVEEREKSKLGMADFRSHGRVLEYNPRQVRDLDEMALWKMFYKKGLKYKELLHKLKPDLVSKIVEDVSDQDLSINSEETQQYGDAQMSKWYEDELKGVSETEDEDNEPEKSEYERIRDKNIEELEALKEASGLFND